MRERIFDGFDKGGNMRISNGIIFLSKLNIPIGLTGGGCLVVVDTVAGFVDETSYSNFVFVEVFLVHINVLNSILSARDQAY